MRTTAALGMPCCNCDARLGRGAPNSLYCSELCQQEAEFVRYARRVRKDGRNQRQDVREALVIQRAWLLSGGYNARERQLSDDVRRLVIARAHGLCQAGCGALGSEIDHITDRPEEGQLNRPDNLQFLCHDCHTRKTMERIGSLQLEEDPERRNAIRAKARELDLRIDGVTPLRMSDDDVTWPKVWQREARKREQARS
ncbi:MAG: HNH endonuclease [Chloroflexota bacterium]